MQAAIDWITECNYLDRFNIPDLVHPNMVPIDGLTTYSGLRVFDHYDVPLNVTLKYDMGITHSARVTVDNYYQNPKPDLFGFNLNCPISHYVNVLHPLCNVMLHSSRHGRDEVADYPGLGWSNNLLMRGTHLIQKYI